MIIEIILMVLIIWNITLSYCLFKFYYIEYKSLEDIIIKLMAGYSSDEIAQEAKDGMREICEKRGWKVKE